MQNYIYERDGKCWIPNPTNPLENFADKWNKNPIKKEKFMIWLYQARNDFDIAFNANDLLTFSVSLRAFIGDKAVDNVSASLNLTLQESPKSIQLGDYSHVLLPKWQMNIKRHVTVACFATMVNKTPTSNQVKRLPIISGMPIGKVLSLNFEIKGINTYDLDEVYWQVVNTGEEARKANGLRGDFYRGYNNGINRNESTLYKGIHLVQCFVIKNEKCIAVSDKFIVKVI